MIKSRLREETKSPTSGMPDLFGIPRSDLRSVQNSPPAEPEVGSTRLRTDDPVAASCSASSTHLQPSRCYLLEHGQGQPSKSTYDRRDGSADAASPVYGRQHARQIRPCRRARNAELKLAVKLHHCSTAPIRVKMWSNFGQESIVALFHDQVARVE